MTMTFGQNGQSTKLPPFLSPATPSVFTLEITRRCHHHCVGCGNVFDHTHQELTLDTWTDIVDRLKPYTQALRITGGEPTLHQQFPEIMAMLDSQGVPLVLFTNGNWINPPAVIDTLKKLVNLRGILVSLHGYSEESFQQFTGTAAFNQVVKNIRYAAAAGLRVATNTLLLTSTINHLKKIADLSIASGCATVSFGRYYGRPLPGLSLTDQQLKSALNEIAVLHRTDPRITLSNCVPACFMPDLPFEQRGCTSGITHCTIGPAGEVRPCTHTPLILGYIQRDNIETLWQSPRLVEWRNKIPQACLGCAVFNRCRGGCRATAAEVGTTCDPLMTTPLAQIRALPVVELSTHDRPKLNCLVEKTSYGYSLNGAGHFVTLSPQSQQILQALDGTHTVQYIQDRFGPVGPEFVGSLLQKKLVKLI